MGAIGLARLKNTSMPWVTPMAGAHRQVAKKTAVSSAEPKHDQAPIIALVCSAALKAFCTASHTRLLGQPDAGSTQGAPMVSAASRPAPLRRHRNAVASAAIHRTCYAADHRMPLAMPSSGGRLRPSPGRAGFLGGRRTGHRSVPGIILG